MEDKRKEKNRDYLFMFAHLFTVSVSDAPSMAVGSNHQLFGGAAITSPIVPSSQTRESQLVFSFQNLVTCCLERFLELLKYHLEISSTSCLEF